MASGLNNDGYGEALAVDDSLRIRELFAILFRSKRLIVVVATIVVGCVILWVGTRTPSYRARATLLLEGNDGGGGVLSELASLTTNTAAEAEIALLTSRSLATVTAAGSPTWTPESGLFQATEPDFDPFAVSDDESGADLRLQGDPSAMENLGLACVVERHDLRPLAGIRRRLLREDLEAHRLYASMEQAEFEGEERPSSLTVQFSGEPGSERVLVAASPGLFGGGLSGTAVEYTPGMTIEVEGWRVRLFAVGGFADQSYTVERLPEEDAILELMENVTAVESGRKTNVIYVYVGASDPYRAAEIANALCKNYLRRNVGIGRQKATQTVRFIDAQLKEQLAALREAERKVVDIQTNYPETIALSATAESLIGQMSQIELQRTQEEIARRVIQDALALLAAGDYEALARIGQEMPGVITLSYIKELGQLEIESLRLDRTDIDGYKLLLNTERLRLRTLEEASAAHAQQLADGLMILESGDASGMARIDSFEDESPFEEYVAEIARLDGEISRQRGASTKNNPRVRSLEMARDDLVVRLSGQVRGARDGARAASASYKSLGEDYAKSLIEWPLEERGTIDAAVSALRTRVRATLGAQASGVRDRIDDIDEVKREIEARLGALPKSELILAEPLREREARTQIVEFLLSSQQEAAITAASTSAAAVLIDPAVPPRARNFPEVTAFILVGGLIGLLIGCAAALVHNAYRGALYSEAEIERISGLSVVGSIPDYLRGATRVKGTQSDKRFLPMRDAPNGVQAEAYRQIRASLRLSMAGDDALHTLAVTSCVPKEGKTVANADLAIVFCGTGRKVLLVDCDLRRPQVHRLFGVGRGPGFAEVLESGADWRDCVHATGENSPDVLPAGTCSASPGELLAGDRALPVIEELVKAYDLVVFDLPPAVVVADVANFAGKLDAVLLLYRSGGVSGRLLASAAGRLARAGVNVMGVIVNAVYVPRASGAYGYGSYHDYSSVQEDED